MGGEDRIMASNQNQAKCLIVGDGAIGKTCLLSTFTNDVIEWEEEPEYEPTTFNNFILMWEKDGQEIEIEMWDTAGQEAFEQLRKLSYPGTDVFLVGFSCVSVTSLHNIQHKWLPEIKEGDDDPWTVVVGTKCDLRAQTPDKAVPVEQAEDVCKAIGACALVDTSAKTREGVDKLNDVMMTLAFMKKDNKTRPKFGDLEEKPVIVAITTKVDKSQQKVTEEQKAAAPKDKVKKEKSKEAPAPAKTEPEAKTDQAKPAPPSNKPTDQATGGTATKQQAPSKPTGHANNKQDNNEPPGCSCTII